MEQMSKDTDLNIADVVSDYIETSYKLAVINVNQKTADISATTAFYMIAGMAFFLIVMFFGIAASLWIGGLLGNNIVGFLVVAFLFLLCLIFFFIRKKAFYLYVKNLIVKSMYE